MADSSAVDVAILARLANDPQLATLAPDGVWYDTAPQGSRRFVIVSLLSHTAEFMFGAEAYEIFTYSVKATAIGSSAVASSTRAAWQRINALLDDAAISPDGYTDMRITKVQYFHTPEPDDFSGAEWQHVGAYYEVWVSANDALEVTDYGETSRQ